ncbi:hypothetical protein [Catellatospora tritici]|nr:hypothetical protein [Catellatospora tritici]
MRVSLHEGDTVTAARAVADMYGISRPDEQRATSRLAAIAA